MKDESVLRGFVEGLRIKRDREAECMEAGQERMAWACKMGILGA